MKKTGGYTIPQMPNGVLWDGKIAGCFFCFFLHMEWQWCVKEDLPILRINVLCYLESTWINYVPSQSAWERSWVILGVGASR